MTDELRIAERALDAALCNFCNNVEDPIPDVPLWTESVRKDYDMVCEAYSKWVEQLRLRDRQKS